MPPDRGPTHYEVLHVPVDATSEVITRAYRAQAKIAHPDAGGDPATFRRLRIAYDELIDETRRLEYNDRVGIRTPIAPGVDAAGPVHGWSGAAGAFTGDVEFPAYLRDITDSPWRPSTRATEPEPAGVDPSSPTQPAEVVWWWPHQAVAPPVPAGPLLLVSAPDAVVAVSTLTGHEAWRAPLGASLRRPVVVLADTVVAWTEDGALHGLELGRGVTRWHKHVGPPSPGGLTTAGPLVIGAGADGRLLGVEPAHGTVSWSARLAAAATASLATMPGAGQVVAITADRRTVEAIETRKGRHRWRLTLRSPVDLPPCPVGDAVWLAGGGQTGSLVQLDGATGAVVGTFRGGTAIAGLVSDDRLLYASVAGPSRLIAVDDAGRVHVGVTTPQVCPEPALSGTHAFLADPAGRLLAVDLTTGTITAAANLAFDPLGPPQLVGDHLVFVARDGRLWATNPPGRSAPRDGDW